MMRPDSRFNPWPWKVLALHVAFLALAIPTAASDGFPHPEGAFSAASSEPIQAIRALIDSARYAAAETLARETLAEVERLHGAESLQAAEILDLLVESLRRGGQAARPETQELAERAVKIKERALGPDHPDLATSLNGLGHVLSGSDDLAGAKLLFERSVTLWEKAYGPDHPKTAIGFCDLGNCLRNLGDLPRARELLERSVAILEGVQGPEHAQIAMVLIDLAHLLADTEEFAGARRLYERALAIQETSYGPDDPRVAAVLAPLAYLLTETADYPGAESLFERAIAIQEKAYGSASPSLAKTLLNYAILKDKTGSDVEARDLYERALKSAEVALGPEHTIVAVILGNYGVLLQRMEDYVASLRSYERALAIFERTLGPEHDRTGWILSNLGHLYTELGEYDRAIELYERSLTIQEKNWGARHQHVAWALRGLAETRHKKGDLQEARELLHRALSIDQEILGPDHPDVAVDLHLLGDVLRDLGDLDQAGSLYARVLSIREKALGPDHHDMTYPLTSLGDVFRKKGDARRAMENYAQALRIAEKVHGSDHHHVAMCLLPIAQLLYEMNEPERAAETALRAERTAVDRVTLIVRGVGESLAGRLVQTRISGRDLLLTIAASGHEGRLVWDSLIRSRGIVLDEMAARHRMAEATGDAQMARLRDDYAGKSERLAGLLVRGSEHEAEPGRPDPLELARREADAAEFALAQANAEFRDDRARGRIGFTEVASALPKGSALVAYALYDAAAPDRPEPSYAAFVLHAGSAAPVVIGLGPAAGIDERISGWRKEINAGRRPAGRTWGEAESACRRAGALVREAVFDPVAESIAGADPVFIVPDGALHLISFAALPVGDLAFLVEAGPTLHYLSAERDLVPVTSGSDRRGRGLLAAGGPDFDAETHPESLLVGASPMTFRGGKAGGGGFSSLAFEPLPGAVKEVEGVSAIWSRKTKEECLLLEGKAASETAVKHEAPGKRVLHLATHGFFLGDGPPSSYRDDEGIDAVAAASASDPDHPPRLENENSLFRTGLAFAGANRREAAPEGQDDGILTAQEIATLDLRGVEWAVLSACDTGAGEVRTGEGVFGLRRAFQVAGARMLVMSLWPVEDEEARAWMQIFYEARFGSGLAVAEAARRASLALLRESRAAGKRGHPAGWAAFVAAGDWR